MNARLTTRRKSILRPVAVGRIGWYEFCYRFERMTLDRTTQWGWIFLLVLGACGHSVQSESDVAQAQADVYPAQDRAILNDIVAHPNRYCRQIVDSSDVVIVFAMGTKPVGSALACQAIQFEYLHQDVEVADQLRSMRACENVANGSTSYVQLETGACVTQATLPDGSLYNAYYDVTNTYHLALRPRGPVSANPNGVQISSRPFPGGFEWNRELLETEASAISSETGCALYSRNVFGRVPSGALVIKDPVQPAPDGNYPALSDNISRLVDDISTDKAQGCSYRLEVSLCWLSMRVFKVCGGSLSLLFAARISSGSDDNYYRPQDQFLLDQVMRPSSQNPAQRKSTGQNLYRTTSSRYLAGEKLLVSAQTNEFGGAGGINFQWWAGLGVRGSSTLPYGFHGTPGPSSMSAGYATNGCIMTDNAVAHWIYRAAKSGIKVVAAIGE